ncbi:unnamed protein product [Caenorhabditis auriculariae]|uniref:glucuronosyltransferase n=1 Tax=Caenorhabditis auriculariae TaxID=2777116 RepID=A0A8S1HK71_9PELO|nr:unnamed protein product [Caenorhabditis auriculariae]
MNLQLLLLLTCCSTVAIAYKVAVLVPNMANSQVQFNARVAESLTNAGHNVTLVYLSYFSDYDSSDVKIDSRIQKYDAQGHVEGMKKADFEKIQAKFIYKDTGMFDWEMMAMIQNMTQMWREGCRNLLRNKEFMTWFENEKFDVAFSHMYSACPIGIIHIAKIPSWVWLNSGALWDGVANVIGVPIIPSYIPPIMMEAMDTMTFYERIKSFIGHVLTQIIWVKMNTDKETALFREEFGADFPDLLEVAAKCPLVMVNTNEIYDVPRPYLDKVVKIGGLGVGFSDAKPLKGEFKEIAEKADGMIVFSFGSVAAAHEMPENWKQAFLDAFREFPNNHFLWRYVADDLKDRLPPNVHTFNWLPQKDLLLHKKTKAFITHGGYNSLQEAISAGVPLITIALFGDQPKNAMLAKKHGFAVSVKKDTLSKEHVVEAIRTILNDDSYSQKVKRLSAMAKNKPIQPATLLVRWTEFLAEFKTLDNLVPAGQKLNFFQYHSLDVMAFLLAAILLILFILYKVVKFVACFVIRKVRSLFGYGKTEKVKQQ